MNVPSQLTPWLRFGAASAAPALVCACGPTHGSGLGAPVDAALANDALSDVKVAEAGALDTDAAAPMSYVVPVATQIVDDMRSLGTDGPGTSGGWFTYSDRQVPWSQTALGAHGPGLVMPPEGDSVPPTNDGQGPTVVGSTQLYRRFWGGGEATWGAGLGMSFVDAPPDGGPVPMNECDAGAVFDVDAAGMDSRVNLPFDASAWTGIQFWAKSLTGYPRDVKVIVLDDRTSAFGLASDAGGCNVCANFTPGASGYCGDGPRASVVFSPEWTHVQLPLASLHPLALYSGEPLTWTPDVSALYGINFQVEDAPLAPFDLAVAYIELYK
jgi:hypothetical protein